jgi:hypothetical protein
MTCTEPVQINILMAVLPTEYRVDARAGLAPEGNSFLSLETSWIGFQSWSVYSRIHCD